MLLYVKNTSFGTNSTNMVPEKMCFMKVNVSYQQNVTYFNKTYLLLQTIIPKFLVMSFWYKIAALDFQAVVFF